MINPTINKVKKVKAKYTIKTALLPSNLIIIIKISNMIKKQEKYISTSKLERIMN